MTTFFCDANTALEIRGNKAYGQENTGDGWHDDGHSFSVPMDVHRARALVGRYLPFVGAPGQAQAVSALISRHISVGAL